VGGTRDVVEDHGTAANREPRGAGRYLGAPVVGVEAVRQGDDAPRDVVEVEDGGEGVEAGGVELVAVPHGELPEALEVPLTDVPRHQGQALRYHRLRPVLPRAGGWLSPHFGGDTHGTPTLWASLGGSR